jgi:hypothetical protein
MGYIAEVTDTEAVCGMVVTHPASEQYHHPATGSTVIVMFILLSNVILLLSWT